MPSLSVSSSFQIKYFFFIQENLKIKTKNTLVIMDKIMNNSFFSMGVRKTMDTYYIKQKCKK